MKYLDWVIVFNFSFQILKKIEDERQIRIGISKSGHHINTAANTMCLCVQAKIIHNIMNIKLISASSKFLFVLNVKLRSKECYSLNYN